MMTDRVPDGLYLYVDIDGGDTCRKWVERRSFSQNSLTTIEAGRSQVANGFTGTDRSQVAKDGGLKI